MPKTGDIPFSEMRDLSCSGVFIKHFDRYGTVTMRPYAHRDDYYIVVLLTEGAAAVEIDFERIALTAGDILIVSPWQVHRKPADEYWSADGWMLAFAPEMLTESEARLIEEYSISPRPIVPDADTVSDIVTLCSMLERHSAGDGVSTALAGAVKSLVLSAVSTPDRKASGRYMAITLKLRKLIDLHLTEQKSPAAYASMLSISEVYLNEVVKGATGLSVGAYIRGRVLVEARRLLIYTSMSAQEIAYSLGYDDYPYFSKLFRKHTGVSPTAYRKNLK